MRTDHMTLAAFASASMTTGGLGAWMHPATDLGIVDPDYYINLARSLERGGFDILFFDDRLAMPAVFGNSVAETARLGSRAVKLDLITILAMVSAHTSRIGLGATYSTTYYQPYHVARIFATLDHMTRGRAIWNIVTSLNNNEAENFGVDYLQPGDRYDRADEFLEIVTGLWESWERDALKLDRTTGIFADPAKVHELNYKGQYLSSRGPLTVPQPPQGWPVLLQAGQSGRGLAFAGRWADLTFTGPGSIESARKHYAEQHKVCRQAGRMTAPKILPAVQVIVGETDALAQERNRFFESIASPEEELITFSEQSNCDFSVFPMDEPLPENIMGSITGVRGLVEKNILELRQKHGPQATLRQLGEHLTRHASVRIVGDPRYVTDVLQEWFQTEACDGFAIIPSHDPGSFEDFGRLVVPELRHRGLVPELNQGQHQTVRQRLGLGRRESR